VADRRFLTDRFLRSLPPAKRRHRNDIWDTSIPGFGVRVYDAKDNDPARRGKAGKISFILYARFGGIPGAARHRHLRRNHAGGSATQGRGMALHDRPGHRPHRR
jgi:hypothetical protein